jgi:hypothetical protein
LKFSRDLNLSIPLSLANINRDRVYVCSFPSIQIPTRRGSADVDPETPLPPSNLIAGSRRIIDAHVQGSLGSMAKVTAQQSTSLVKNALERLRLCKMNATSSSSSSSSIALRTRATTSSPLFEAAATEDLFPNPNLAAFGSFGASPLIYVQPRLDSLSLKTLILVQLFSIPRLFPSVLSICHVS